MDDQPEKEQQQQQPSPMVPILLVVVICRCVGQFIRYDVRLAKECLNKNETGRLEFVACF
jgi:hypothetical protein